MKFKIDYDMMKKISHAKDGIRASERFWGTIKHMPSIHVFNFFGFINDLENIIKNHNVKENILLISSYIVLYGAGYCLCACDAKAKKDEYKYLASNELQGLATRLYNLEVRTSAELLKDAKLNQTKYKIVFSDGDIKVPKLKQYKYIDVPLSNGYEETILQEHVFGDKDYDISVQSPIKKHQFKLARASMGA